MSYHSGKNWKERKDIQDGFMSNKYPIVVATIGKMLALINVIPFSHLCCSIRNGEKHQ